MSKNIPHILIGMVLGLMAGGFIAILIGDSKVSNLLLWVGLIAGGVIGHTLASKTPTAEVKRDYPPMPVFPYNSGGTHGTANWTNPEHIDILFNEGNFDHYIDGGGYYIGEGRNILPLLHAICIAGSGQGKNGTLILANLLKKAFASWFVIDIKGENAKTTARWQQNCGQRVVILDPFNEQARLHATHGIEPMGFNPLDFVQSNPEEMAESCAVIAEMLIPDTNSQSKDEYWSSRARSLLKTYLLHLVTGRPEEERHLGTLYRWLRLSPRERQRLWFEMDENLACDELVKSGINEFIGMSEDSGPLPSIISTAQDNTSFLESSALRKSLMGSGFNPYDLTDGKTTVYLCLPERFLETHYRWLRLVVGVCLKACNHRPNKRVNFLLDEFPILQKMPAVEKAFAFGRGQNISCWIFAQSLTQLIDIYGEHGANGLLANARLRQFFGVLDLPTQKYLSEYLGDTTIRTTTKSQSISNGQTRGSSSGNNGGGSSSGTSWSHTESTNNQEISRRLLTVEEIGKMHDIITLIDGYKFLLARLPYWGSLYEAFVKGQYRFYPLTEQVWHYFIDQLRYEAPQARHDLGNTFAPRADDERTLLLSNSDAEESLAV